MIEGRTCIKGLVIKKISDFFYVKSEQHTYVSKPRGVFKKEKKDIRVGDYVDITVTHEYDKEAVIEKIHTRKNSLIRPNVANIDNILTVFSAKEPAFNFFLVDTFLVTIENIGIHSIIVINKSDLDKEGNCRHYEDIYKSIGYETVCVSTYTGEGIQSLKSVLKSGITVVAGPSGVGKSSIINMLSDKFDQKTSQISTRLQKGKNTTTYASMLQIGDGSYIVDTPGFTSIRTDEIKKEELKKCFVEFDRYSSGCFYAAKCMHDKEPDCAVKDALERGDIHESRYLSYIGMLKNAEKAEKRRKYR